MDMKKTKNTTRKRLFSAIAMLTCSAVMLSTATYAWFTMNRDVTVNNLTVKAQAEEGLVIAAYTSNGATAPVAAAFADEADAYNTLSGTYTLLPTFTEDGTTWWHQTSKKSNDGQDYAETAAVTVTNDTTNHVYYYEENKFQIKSYGAVSGSTAATQAVYVKSVSVDSRTAQAYDPSLRVLIKSADYALVFDGTGQRTDTENLLGDSSIATVTLVEENTTDAKILDAASTTAQDVTIYLYFDGEDAACKSDNIVDFTDISVDVVFTTEAPSAAAP
jgi:hypothetical protein